MKDAEHSPELSQEELRQRTREGWARSAAGWGSHWPTIESMGANLTQAMLDRAHLRPGLQVLDVATGIGEPAVSAARTVGPTGRVTAVDSSPDMLDHARQRAERLGLTNLTYVCADMEELPDALPEGVSPPAFDAAFSRFGLMFAIEPFQVLPRLRSCLKSGGRMVLAVWGPQDAVPLINIPTQALADVFDQPQPDPEVPGPFRFSDPSRRLHLLHSLEAHGFDNAVESVQEVVLDLDSADAFATFSLATSSRSRSLLETRPEKTEDYVSALVEGTADYLAPNGRVRLVNQAWLISALAT